MIAIKEEWECIRQHFRSSLRSTSHFVVTLLDDEGFPRPMPIGSVLLNKTQEGFFFEQFTSSFSRFGKPGQKICVLAVNTNRWLWLKAIFRGYFYRPPAIRLYGRLGERRKATEKEKERFQRLVRPLRRTKGYNLMWKEMNMVRELKFERAEMAMLGKMTERVARELGSKAPESIVQ